MYSVVSAEGESRPRGPTLRQILDEEREWKLAQSKRDTVKEYERAVDRWERWQQERLGATTEDQSGGQNHWSTSPVVLITLAQLLEFRQLFIACPECGDVQNEPAGGPITCPKCAREYRRKSNRDANRHVERIRSVLRWAWEKGHLPRPPAKVAKLEERAAPKLILSHEQIARLYDACNVATWPTRTPRLGRQCQELPYSPCQGWRALLVAFYNLGGRTQDLVARTADDIPLLACELSWRRESPDDDSAAESPHGWLDHRPQKQRGRKRVVLPLNETLSRHLRTVLADRADRYPVFHWPRASKEIARQWAAICEASGVRIKGQLPEIRHLRKAAITHLNRHRRGLALLVVGHAKQSQRDLLTKLLAENSRVANKHYDAPDQWLVDSLASYPQPAAFLAGDTDRQKRLF